MSAPPWWDPRTLLDGPDVPPSIKSQLATAAVLGADPGERDGWRQAAERAGVTIGATGLGSADPAREYRDALAAARSAEEAAQDRIGLEHASGMTVDAMLDAGAVGLLFFEQFLPLASALAPIELDTSEVRRRFDGQRGMDVAALESDAEQVRSQVRAAAEQLDLQRVQLSRLLEEQSGVAVDAAGTYLRDHLARAERDLDHLRRCGDALSAAAHTLWSVVRDKSKMTAGLYTGEVGGRTAAQITLMIESVCGGGAPDHAAAAAVTGWQPAVPGVSAAAPVAAVRAACERWLRDVFVLSVQSRCRAFVALCDQTEVAVDETFRALRALLDVTDDSPYPRPGGGAVSCAPAGTGVAAPPIVGGPAAEGLTDEGLATWEPTASGPFPAASPAATGDTAQGSAVFASPASYAFDVPAEATPAVPAPGVSAGPPEPTDRPPQDPVDWRAAAPNALPGSVSAGVAGVPGLSALVGDFGGQVARVASEVGEALLEAGNALHEVISEPAPHPAPVVLGDFTVALDLAPEAVSLQVTGPDGQPHGYAMTIGPDGVPRLTAIEPGDPDAVSDDPRDPTPATSDPIGAPPSPPDRSIDGGAPHDGPLDMVDRPSPEPAEEPAPVEEPGPVDRSMPESEPVPAEPVPVTTPPIPDDTGARLAESWE